MLRVERNEEILPEELKRVNVLVFTVGSDRFYKFYTTSESESEQKGGSVCSWYRGNRATIALVRGRTMD